MRRGALSLLCSKFSGVVRIFFVLSFMFSALQALSQVPPSEGPREGRQWIDQTGIWTVFGAGSMARESSQNIRGWDAGVANFPYKEHPWAGGTLDISGNYYKTTGSNGSLYAVLAGPSVSLTNRAVEPYARFLWAPPSIASPPPSTKSRPL